MSTDSAAAAAGLVSPEETQDDLTVHQLTAAMSELENARTCLRNAAKQLHLAGVGEPIHRNVLFMMDAVSEEEARLTNYMGGEG